MAVDLNMDVGAIIKAFIEKKKAGGTSSNTSGKSSELSQKIEPFKYLIGSVVGLGLLTTGYVTFLYSPIKKENTTKTDELNKLVDMKDKIGQINSQIAIIKKKLDSSKQEYIEELSHFGNSEDLGELYQSISTIAAKYNLVVLNIKEATPPPAPASTAKAPAATKTPAGTPEAAAPPPPEEPKTKVSEIRVDLELKGNYGDYIKFKEDLAIAEVLLKINTENIKVKTDKEAGVIYIKLNVSTFAIDKKPFENVIANNV